MGNRAIVWRDAERTGGEPQAYNSKRKEVGITFRLQRNGIIMPVDKDEK